jgi:CheY-like chemotaxis protein
MPDYLGLGADAEDFAAWTPDAELAVTYRQLAGSYYALARFHDRISTFFRVVADDLGNREWFSHVSATMKVMLLEDDKLVRAAVADSLENAGLQVAEFSDPNDALNPPEPVEQPDLVITDVDLGSTLNGFDVAAAVHERWPSVHVLLISGLPAAHTRQRLDPRDRYLQKPLSSTRLLRAIEELAKAA